MRNSIELRKAKRYQLSAPAIFLWAPLDGKPQSGLGITRDINTFGIYVQTDEMPAVGSLVQMEIVLPKLTENGPGMHLHGEGVVLRCDYLGIHHSGFAASAQFYPDVPDGVLSQLKVTAQVI
jgi:hypothetical protein